MPAKEFNAQVRSGLASQVKWESGVTVSNSSVLGRLNVMALDLASGCGNKLRHFFVCVGTKVEEGRTTLSGVRFV
jgi:hypothetical protein